MIDRSTNILNPLRECTKPQWYYPVPAVGGGGKKIQGKLTALETRTGGPYAGLKVGEIEVEVAPCSDAGLLGQTIEVVDWSECVFDLPFADLDGVWVWASQGIGLSRAGGPDPNERTPCHFAADDRCCVAADGV